MEQLWNSCEVCEAIVNPMLFWHISRSRWIGTRQIVTEGGLAVWIRKLLSVGGNLLTSLNNLVSWRRRCLVSGVSTGAKSDRVWRTSRQNQS